MGSAASNLKKGDVFVQTASVYIQTDPWHPAETAGAPQGAEADIIQPVQMQVICSAPEVSPIEATWLAVCESLDIPEGKKNPNTDLVVKRTGWKTIRIFVSSTFKDFHDERELLVKEVFPDLRAWCESRRLHLVECDLRWGVPKDSTTELTLRTCLGEIDRCYQDNVMPYFLNMTSERIGWVPLHGEVPQNLVDEYRWVFGLSVTEMEIIHGAYRKDNPNSLFMIRDDSFMKTVPENQRPVFRDENPIAPAKLQALKNKIRDRFPPSRVVTYKCTYNKVDPNTQKARLHVDEEFRDRVMKFFKDRISIQYPLLETEEDPMERKREAHESFMKSRSELVLGRANVIETIMQYIDTGGSDTPTLILGGPGTGKSSIMAKATDEIITKALNKKIPGAGGNNKWHVFYHFVGAVPGSTDLRETLIRLLQEIKVVDETNMPSDLDSTVQLACSTLNNAATPPVIIIIDALNQFDDDKAAKGMMWLPRKLSPSVRCVFSMIHDTPQHKSLMSRESKPAEFVVRPLDLNIRKNMVTEYLGKFNKRLDMDQMIMLLSKRASENPLWLSIVCEELRIFGQFRSLHEKIDEFADDLLDLLQQVLGRFEEEGGGDLLKATLCLLEVSSTGLLESELLSLLADEASLKPPKPGDEKGDKEKSEKEKSKFNKKLPAFEWSGIYRSLRPFLRPFGNSGEGRLDFYHRSLSKAVRKKYLKVENEDVEEGTLSPTYVFWHSKLADYFTWSDNYDRKVEELPYHLVKLNRPAKLEKFLSEWPAFERLFDKEHSSKLLRYWRVCGGKDRVLECYAEKLQELQEEGGGVSEDLLSKRFEQVGRFLVQCGDYKFSEDLGRKALELETEKLGNRPERLVELNNLMAAIWDERSKLHEFCSVEQVPELTECIGYHQKAIDLLVNMKGSYYRIALAKQYKKIGFSLASFADCGGSEELPALEAIQLGHEVIEKAVTVFKQEHDNGNLAEAYMTKAVLLRHNKQKQLKLYEEALELCLQTYGRYHQLTGRINFNTAICYEDYGYYDRAYDLFKENYLIQKEVYGPGHVKYQRARDLFDEPSYKRIRRNRNDTDFD